MVPATSAGRQFWETLRSDKSGDEGFGRIRDQASDARCRVRSQAIMASATATMGNTA
jgi:hypothetical protein